MIDDLAPARVEVELTRAGATIGRPLSVVVETISTNDDARAAAARGAPHGATFVADAQTRGRGRGGHAWHSPPGENLYLSVVARPRVEASRVAAFALITGLAVARAVDRLAAPTSETVFGIGQVKWPNDVLVGGRKIAGVLAEAQLRGARVDALVLGIGLDVRTRDFPPALDAVATSLVQIGGETDRARCLAVLLAELGLALAAFETNGLEPALVELRRRDALRGVQLRVGDVGGVGAGLDSEGRLLVRDAQGGLHAVASGSVERTPTAAGT